MGTLILIFVLFGVMIIVTFYMLIKSADNFFREADKIEKMIINNEPKEMVFKAILKLQKQSFHQRTAARISELGKMYELNYKIKNDKHDNPIL
jgi:polyphosphate kinase 2 (PPK2 family)